VPFDGITSRNAVLISGYFRTHGVMSSVYYRNNSRNSWQGSAPGLPRVPYGLKGLGQHSIRLRSTKVQGSIEVRMQQVIVQPDTIGPWIGVVGVVLGIAITTATDGLRSRRRDRKERLRANQAAADELLAAANTLIVVRGMFDMAVSSPGYGGQGDSPSEWVMLWVRQSERIQKASEELQRYGPDNLAALGIKVAQAANVTPVRVKEDFPKELENLLAEFATVMRTTLGRPAQARQTNSASSGGEPIAAHVWREAIDSTRRSVESGLTEVGMARDKRPEPLPEDQIPELGPNVSPSKAVASSVAKVERLLRKLLADHGAIDTSSLNMRQLASRALQSALIDAKLADSINGLDIMRLLAEMDQGRLTPQRATEFVNLSTVIVYLIELAASANN
jgi:hypothetical protein